MDEKIYLRKGSNPRPLGYKGVLTIVLVLFL
jgi:hypothetical protein